MTDRDPFDTLREDPFEKGLRITAVGTKSMFRAEIGPWDPEKWEGRGGFEFGMTAEVYRSTSYGSDEQVAEVSFPAIGSHSPEVARVRLRAYQEAINIAAALNGMPELADNEVAARHFDGGTR